MICLKPDDAVLFDMSRFRAFASCAHEGHGGASWADLVAGAPSWLDTLGTNPDWVFVQAGTNDALQSTSAESSLSAAVQVVELIESRFPAATLVVVLPPRLADPAQDTRRSELSTPIAATLEGRRVVDLAEHVGGPEDLQPDGVHFTAEAEARMTGALLRATGSGWRASLRRCP